MDAKDVLKLVEDEKVEWVDLKFADLFSQWHHFTIPVSELTEESFEEGIGFDGSSIRAWQAINMSDMSVLPDPATAFIDPFFERKTLTLICDVVDPVTRENYSKDPRFVAHKAENYLKSTGIADTAYFGPEAEFFIFDDVRFDYQNHEAFFRVDSHEAWWRTGAEENPNLAYKIPYKRGYFPVPPHDTYTDLRNEMGHVLMSIGIQVEYHHHEVATAGQGEIDIRYAPLLKQADNLMTFKYVLRNVARKYGKTVTFMPKPVFADNGSGMHTHTSLWKDGQPLFAGDKYAGLSDLALHFIAGVLKHAKAICAFTNPTTNSYRRLVPGYEAPVKLAYSSRNRSAAVRVPMYSPSPKAKRVEVRFPDPTANPYLAFSAILMAGLDGIENKLDPGEPLDKDIYALPPEEVAAVPSTPASLEEALEALSEDREFLLKGGVFTDELIDTWIEWKKENEIDQVKLRTHPYEFVLYFDV